MKVEGFRVQGRYENTAFLVSSFRAQPRNLYCTTVISTYAPRKDDAHCLTCGNGHSAIEISRHVGLSNICYTVLDEIMECIFWRFPSKRSHWEAVIISIIISFELYSEIFKREETMRGIKAFVILAMTAFYFPIVSWGKGTNLFVFDA